MNTTIGEAIGLESCTCGRRKKMNYEQCYQCHLDSLKAEGKLCACGERKKPEFEQCYYCWRGRKDGSVCKCGRMKSPKHEVCSHCWEE